MQLPLQFSQVWMYSLPQQLGHWPCRLVRLVLLDHCSFFLSKHLQLWDPCIRLYHPLHSPVAVMYTLPYSFLHLRKILGSILLSLSLAYFCHNSWWFKYLCGWFSQYLSHLSQSLSSNLPDALYPFCYPHYDHTLFLVIISLNFKRPLTIFPAHSKTLANFQLYWCLIILILSPLCLSFNPFMSYLYLA